MSIYITPPFRMSFPSLFVPTGYLDGPKKYSVTALWSVDDLKTTHKEAWKTLLTAMDAKAKEFFDTPLARLPANIRRGIRNGNEKEHLNGYGEGILFASLSTDRKPQVVDLSKVLIPDGDTQRIYPGAYARASVNVFAYDNIGKGVALGLHNVQWLGHGERLDSVTAATDDFAEDPDAHWFAAAEESVDTDEEQSVAEDPNDFADDIPF